MCTESNHNATGNTQIYNFIEHFSFPCLCSLYTVYTIKEYSIQLCLSLPSCSTSQTNVQILTKSGSGMNFILVHTRLILSPYTQSSNRTYMYYQKRSVAYCVKYVFHYYIQILIEKF